MYRLKLESNGNIVDLNDQQYYTVISVSGLNPPSASLFMSKSPNRKGSKINGSTLDERNVIIQIKLLGDIEFSRNNLYTYFTTEKDVKIHYENKTKNVYCEGTIQDFDFDLFTENEIVSLSIICADPYLKEMAEILAEISYILKQFTFPFAIDSNGIPFSTIKEVNSTNIFNAGDETGARFIIRCKGTLSNISLYDANNINRMFKINYTFYKDWVIEIDTEASPKTCKAISPDGSIINLMKYLSNNPTWFTLKKGNNLFGYSAQSGEENAEISVSFRNKYLGV